MAKDIKSWGVAMILVGLVVLTVSSLVLGNQVLNFVGAALVLFPVVLYLIRVAEAAWKGTGR